MDYQERDFIPVIGSEGNRKKMLISDYKKLCKTNDSPEYDYDVDWELSHGFMTLEETFHNIENDNNN